MSRWGIVFRIRSLPFTCVLSRPGGRLVELLSTRSRPFSLTVSRSTLSLARRICLWNRCPHFPNRPLPFLLFSNLCPLCLLYEEALSSLFTLRDDTFRLAPTIMVSSPSCTVADQRGNMEQSRGLVTMTTAKRSLHQDHIQYCILYQT
jgi:hypothetical protein